jgi:lipopolysaccharide exporter
MSNSLGINIAKLVTSKVAAQAISIATVPIIARLYLPDAFGVRQIFISIASTIVVVSCLRYEISIPLGKDEKESSASLALSMLFTLVFTLAVLAVVPFLRGVIARRFNAPELKAFLWLLPAGVFLGGLRKSLNFWASREGKFGAMAWSAFGSALGTSSTTIVWALILGGTVAGLFAGYLAGAIFGVILLLLFLSRKIISDIRSARLDFATIRTIAKQHKKFPLFSTWSGLLNTVSAQLPPIILGLYFSTIVVGYYSLGHRLVALPMALLGSSVAQVFFPAASKEYNETGDLSGIVGEIFKRLVQIGVFPMVALGLLGAPLFAFIFGKNWTEAGVYAQILSGYLILQFISSPLSAVFGIFQRQGTLLIWNAGLVSSRLLLLALGSRAGKSRTALVLYTIISAIAYSLLLIWIFRRSGVSISWGLKLTLKYLSLSFLLLLPAVCLAGFGQAAHVILLGVAPAIIIYVYGIYRFDSGFRSAVTVFRKKVYLEH